MNAKRAKNKHRAAQLRNKPLAPCILTINGGSSSIKFALFELAIRFGGFWQAELKASAFRRAALR